MVRFFLCVIVIGTAVPVFAAEKPRTWTDSSGSFTMEATLQEFDGKTAKLKKKDGKILSLPAEKLSDEDRKYLSQKKEQSPENPFEVAEKSSAEKKDSKKNAAPKTKAIDLKKSKSVEIQGNIEWKCDPDPAPVQKTSDKVKRILFRMGDVSRTAFPQETDFFFNRDDGKKVLTAFQLDTHRRPDEKSVTKVFLGDVSTGRNSSIDHPKRLTPFGLSPDGTKALFLEGSWEGPFTSGNSRILHVVKCSPNKLEPIFSMEPFAQMQEPNDRFSRTIDVEWAAWATNDHILVSNKEQMLFLISLDTGKAVWRIKVGYGDGAVLSPGGKYLVVHSGREFFLLETLTGKCIGMLDGTNGSGFGQKFTFSPDGKKIASVQLDTVSVWDATTGQAEEPFYIQHVSGLYAPHWVNERFVLADRLLVDTYTKTPVWEYGGGSRNRKFFGGHVWYTVSRHQEGSSLVGVVVPHLKVAAKTPDKEDDRLFVVRPGMTVSLTLDPSIVQDRETIQSAFEEKLRDNDLTLAENAPLSLYLNVSEEKEGTITYQTGQFPFRLNRGGGTEVKYKPKKYSCQFRKGGQTQWEMTAETSPPENISLEDIKDTPLQTIVDREMAKAHYKSWFLNLAIPKKIPLQTELGQTSFDEMGIR